MKKFKFKKLDAFAVNSKGNPAGAIYLNSQKDITEQEMQKIAFELKDLVSEVFFLFPADTKGADFQARYFSSEREVEFCGHATIAVMYDIFKTNPEFIKKDSLNLQINKQTIKIINRIKDSDSVFINAPQPEYINTDINPYELAAALNIKTRAITDKPEIINVGQDILIVPIMDNKTIVELETSYEKLKSFYTKINIPIIIVFTTETNHKENDLRVRVFPAGYGYYEDPATGSANAALGYYLLKNNQLKDITIIEQGPEIQNPNIIKLKLEKANQLYVGGSASLKISGEYFL